MRAEGTLGPAALLGGCEGRDETLLLIPWLRAKGARGGAATADHDGMDFSGRALMDTRWGEMV